MQLEKQVCSLDLAKRLKELGVKQESLFFWWHKWEGSSDKDAGRDIVTLNQHSNTVVIASAFTVAELGEMLPHTHNTTGMCDPNYWEKEGRGKWVCTDDFANNSSPAFYGKTEADARAKMLIYLLENKIINSGSR